MSSHSDEHEERLLRFAFEGDELTQRAAADLLAQCEGCLDYTLEISHHIDRLRAAAELAGKASRHAASVERLGALLEAAIDQRAQAENIVVRDSVPIANPWAVTLFEPLALPKLPASRALAVDAFRLRTASPLPGYLGASRPPAGASGNYLGSYRAGERVFASIRAGAGSSAAVWHVDPTGALTRIPANALRRVADTFEFEGETSSPSGRHRFIVLSGDALEVDDLKLADLRSLESLAPTVQVGYWDYDVEEAGG